MTISWFEADGRRRVVERSTCRVCSDPIVLGAGLDVWLHEDRIAKGKTYNHEALPSPQHNPAKQ